MSGGPGYNLGAVNKGGLVQINSLLSGPPLQSLYGDIGDPNGISGLGVIYRIGNPNGLSGIKW